jgi:exodeoxyribonuclease VII small subunit
MAATRAPASENNFESAMERLEQIVEAMESDKMPLEELIVRYEEGVKLVKVCQDKLDAAEKRIEIIKSGAGGKPRLSEFEPSEISNSSAPNAQAPISAQDASLF